MFAAAWLMLGSLFYSLQLSAGSFPKPLTQEEERHYLALCAAGDPDARNMLIERNLRLVAHIMKKYYAQESDQEDLISIGTIGLIKGISTFDASKGARLATYAARCVENATLSPTTFKERRLHLKVSNSPIGAFGIAFRRIFTSFVKRRIRMRGMLRYISIVSRCVPSGRSWKRLDSINSLQEWESGRKAIRRKCWERYFKGRAYNNRDFHWKSRLFRCNERQQPGYRIIGPVPGCAFSRCR